MMPKNLKGTLWDFLTFFLLKNIKKTLREGPFGDIKKFNLKAIAYRMFSNTGLEITTKKRTSRVLFLY